MHKRVGDTLIEVTLAVGIFSMVAVAAVAVLSGGTSSSQTALETTLAREEIDTQAEAIRFINSAYNADDESGEKNTVYEDLWDEIIRDAVGSTDLNSDEKKAIFAEAVSGVPTSCKDLYDNQIFKDKAFIINTNALGTATNAEEIIIRSSATQNINGTNTSIFQPTNTYPRLISTMDQLNNSDALKEKDSSTLYRAEGIYVIAVEDIDKTNIVGIGGDVTQDLGYYDFYIRTCWYGTGSDKPSSISTVVRIYSDQDDIKRDTPSFNIYYSVKENDTATYTADDGTRPTRQKIYAGQTAVVKENTFERVCYKPATNAAGAQIWKDKDSKEYYWYGLNDSRNSIITAPTVLNSSQSMTLYAQWVEDSDSCAPLTIKWKTNCNEQTKISSIYNNKLVKKGTVEINKSYSSSCIKASSFVKWTPPSSSSINYQSTTSDINSQTQTIRINSIVVNEPTEITFIPEWVPRGPEYMQDENIKDYCSENNNLTIKDERDGNEYTIRKINGRCWMTQNLRIYPQKSNDIDIDCDKTNVTCTGKLKLYKDIGAANLITNNAVAVRYTNNNNLNYYYNYNAAFISNGDICPKGWEIPSRKSFPTSVFGQESVVTGYFDESYKINGAKFQYWWSNTRTYDPSYNEGPCTAFYPGTTVCMEHYYSQYINKATYEFPSTQPRNYYTSITTTNPSKNKGEYKQISSIPRFPVRCVLKQ